MANDLTILSSPYGQNVPYRFEAGFDRFVINTFTNASPRQFSLSDFASVEMISQDKRKQAGKTIGGVAVGAILLGPVGAIAGGLLSGNKNEFLVKVVLTNGVEMLCSHITPSNQRLSKTQQTSSFKPIRQRLLSRHKLRHLKLHLTETFLLHSVRLMPNHQIPKTFGFGLALISWLRFLLPPSTPLGF